MFGIPWIEWMGYVAAVIIIISLLMISPMKVRIVNSVGCLLFVVYGLLVHAYPVAVVNIIIVFVNLYHLYKLNTNE